MYVYIGVLAFDARCNLLVGAFPSPGRWCISLHRVTRRRAGRSPSPPMCPWPRNSRLPAVERGGDDFA